MAEITHEEVLKRKGRHDRLLGLDVGTKTIGLALSDGLWMVATPYQVITRKSHAHDLGALQKVLREFPITALVIGLPLNMNGTEGERAVATRKFAETFSAQLGLDYVLWDERLSTAEVERLMLSADLSRKRRSELVDKLAASVILQGFLDRIRSHQNA
ncbi:MAG: Holliday junction resolvase RuvX [Holosporales bacterium]